MKKGRSRLAEGRSNSESTSGRKPNALPEQAAKPLPEKKPAMPRRDARKVTHGVEVHRSELEMQNEELRRARDTIVALQQRYADLYDSAPVGFFTFDDKELIAEVNLTGASLLGVEEVS